MSRVVITGTSSGIGRATALAFGRAGHTVYATMRDPSRNPELGQIATREGQSLMVVPMDVDSDGSVRAAFDRIIGEGAVDVLINNAGIAPTGSVEQLPLAVFRTVMETNYFGALRCIQAVLPTMRQRGSGCIVNISSISGRIAAAPLASYVASKFALEGLSEALAQELRPFNVRVAIVQPGIIDTPAAQEVAASKEPSLYPHERRFAALFRAVLSQPTPPSLVSEKVLEIVESDTWQLRHPVGPDAAPFLQWRAAMSDEAWIEWGALDDDAWYDRVKAEFGIDARAYTEASLRS